MWINMCDKTTSVSWCCYYLLLICVIQMVQLKSMEPTNRDIMNAVLKIADEVKTLKEEMNTHQSTLYKDMTTLQSDIKVDMTILQITMKDEMTTLQNTMKEAMNIHQSALDEEMKTLQISMKDEMKTFTNDTKEKIGIFQKNTLNSLTSIKSEIESQRGEEKMNTDNLRDMLDVILITSTYYMGDENYSKELYYNITTSNEKNTKHMTEFGSKTDIFYLQTAIMSSFERFRKPGNCSGNKYFTVGLQCFFLPGDSMKTQNWTDANQVCKELGGILAEPRSILDFTKVLLEQSLNINFWLGASDLLVDGEWKWSSDGAMVGNPEGWAPGEPNNSGGKQNCLNMDLRHKYRPLHDRDCDATYNSICEKK